MCRFRPAAVAVAPLLVRGVPGEVAADGTNHTWSSYERTLRRVVIEHDTADDLTHVDCPVHIIQGNDDQVAPPALVQRTLDQAVGAPGRGHVRLDVVDGDHHLVHRHPGVLVDAIRAMAATASPRR